MSDQEKNGPSSTLKQEYTYCTGNDQDWSGRNTLRNQWALIESSQGSHQIDNEALLSE